jgi:hypothetical protein
MVQPIQYQVPLADPFAGLMQGLRLGATVQDLQAAQQQRVLQQEQMRQQMMQRQQAMERQQRFSDFAMRPNKTAADFRQALLDFPEQEKVLAKSYEGLAETELQNQLRDQGVVFSLLSKGKTDEAKQYISNSIEGMRNSGKPAAEIAAAEAMLKTIDVNPELLRTTAGMRLFAAGDRGKAIAENVEKQMAAADPMKLAEREAELAKKIADARIAQQNATTQAQRNAADLALKGFQAQKARIDAEVAATEQRLTGGVGASADVRTAIAAANLPANIKKVMYELESIKQPKTVIDMGGRAEAEARAKDLVAENRDLQNAAAASQKLLASVDVMENLLDSGFQTGWATEAKAAAASFLSALGVPEATKFATSAQTFLAQSREQLLQKLILQKGPQTEGDSQRATQTLATLGNTKEANRFILAFTKAVERRGIDKAKFYRQFEKTNNTFKGADTAWEDGPGDKSIFDSPFLAPFRNIAQGRSAQGQVPRLPPAPAPSPATPSAVAPTPSGSVRDLSDDELLRRLQGRP